MSDGAIWLVFELIGWPLRAFSRWINRQPHRDASQISTLAKIGRLSLGIALSLCILLPLGWAIWG